MELFNSAIILIIIALIWTAIIFLSIKRMMGQQNKKDKNILLGGLLLFVVLATLFVVVAFVYEEVESPGFCGTFCHVMNPYYEDYIHPGGNEMMAVHVAEEVTCSNCHNDPGIVGTIEGLSAALPEAIIYFTNSYDVDDLGGDVSRAACLKCHDGSIAIIPGEVTTALNTSANPHNDEKKCTECHNPHLEGSGLGNDACSVCHGTEIENFEEKLIAHSDRVGANCMECHNRDHPENAKILFSEVPELIDIDFCSDCHSEDKERLKTKVHKSKDCMDCHSEHATLGIEFDNCGDPCHNPPTGHDTSTTGCSFCHDTTKIHLATGYESSDSFSDVICSNCHNAEDSAYTASFTPKSLEIYGDNGCIDCHSDHETKNYPHIITGSFNNCISCHSNYNQPSTIHDRTEVSFEGFSGINKDFCSDCHQEEVDRLSQGAHTFKECTDCHGDHAIIQVDFDNCLSCHGEKIPDWHDESQGECSSCHNTELIHSGSGSGSGGSSSGNSCLSCHDGTPGPIPPETATTAIGITVNPHESDKLCNDCHDDSNHQTGVVYNGLSKEACLVCHGTAIDNFEGKLDSHSNRAGLDCMNCHDREHPTNAKIPFTDYPSMINDEFCSDCHSAEYSSYTSSFTGDSLTFYGDTGCKDCHSEHKDINYPHRKTPPYDICSNCHNSYDQETTVHDRTELSYLGFPDLENDFCSDCHNDEFVSHGEKGHSDINCNICHSDHKIRIEFNECDTEGCHESIVGDFDHDTSMDKCIDICHSTDITLIHSG